MKLSISNYNIVHKSNTCFSKKGDPLSEYYALEDANRSAAFVSNEIGTEMIAYLCTVCNKYHIKPAEYYFNKCEHGCSCTDHNGRSKALYLTRNEA